MGILDRLSSALKLPDAPLTADEVDSSTRMRAHRRALSRKPSFRQTVIDIHDVVIELIDEKLPGDKGSQILEIGSGVIPLKDRCPRALSTDIQDGETIEVVVDATRMPFDDSSFGAIVGQNVFHHLPSARAALPEMARVTVDSGLIILIEPYYGRFARLIFPRLFPIEAFDCKASSKRNYVVKGSEEIPNQAASYVVFVRDWPALSLEFPFVEIVETFPLSSGLRYLLTGGLNFRQVAPDWLLRFLRKFERHAVGRSVLRAFAIHWMVVLRVDHHARPKGLEDHS